MIDKDSKKTNKTQVNFKRWSIYQMKGEKKSEKMKKKSNHENLENLVKYRTRRATNIKQLTSEEREMINFEYFDDDISK